MLSESSVLPQHFWVGGVTDGQSAASWPVQVTLRPDGLGLTRPGAELPVAIWAYGDVATAEPVRPGAKDVLITSSSASRMTLFVADAAFVTEFGRLAPHTSLKAARMAGLKPGAIAGAIAFGAVAIIYAFDYSPTKSVARLMPDAARERLGNSVLSSLPVRETCTEPEGRAALDALVVRLLPKATDIATKVTVRNWNLVNAFAVPGGQVVLTRAIIEKAASADEIAGVLAHEIGHALELHPEAGLVRSVGFWALIQMVFTGTPGALGNIGSTLAQLAHNRGFEREADTIALKLLKDAGISQKPFAGFFKRMEGTRTEKKPDMSPRGRLSLPNDLFETHPSTPERIKHIEGQPEYPSTPALTPVQWQALRRICGAAAVTPPTVPGGSSPPTLPTPSASLEEQIKAATARIAQQPNIAANHAARAEIYVRATRHSDAIADFDKAIAIEPGNPQFHYQRGSAKTAIRDFDGAITDFGEAVRINPSHTAALASRGSAYKQRRQNDAAMRDYDAALAINPRYQFALYNRGLLHGELQRWALAEQDFGRVIEGNKAYAYAYVRRGEALEKLGQRDKAIADYREALKGAPSSPNATEAFRVARVRLQELGVAER